MSTGQLIVSIGVILLAARGFGWLFQRIGQPRVVGEMVAGIVLGPSLLGHFLPAASAYIFPSSSLSILNALSQLGILLFMFIVGLEVDPKHLWGQRVTVVVSSQLSIVVPFLLGLGLARMLYGQFAGKDVPFSYFAMFMGTAMSVTAFPVLARILKERGMLGTNLGVLAISCAAVGDVTAWLLLAVLTAMARSSQGWQGFAFAFLKLALFVAFMVWPGRRLASLLKTYYSRHGVSLGIFSIVILVMLAASWVTEEIGVHALFGSFVVGLILPKNKGLVMGVIEKVESLTLTLLLPLFFALTGLHTRIDLITGASMWGYAALITGAATIGKFAGSSLPARISGMSWKNSVGLGVLMNTRGLVELVVLSLGMELGILSPALFAMMVMMALVTTFIATPILVAMKIAPAREKISQFVPAVELEQVG